MNGMRETTTNQDYTYSVREYIANNSTFINPEIRLRQILNEIRRSGNSIYEFDRLYGFLLKELTYPDISSMEYSYHVSLRNTETNYAKLFIVVKGKVWTRHKMLLPYFQKFVTHFSTNIQNALECLAEEQ